MSFGVFRMVGVSYIILCYTNSIGILHGITYYIYLRYMCLVLHLNVILYMP